MIGNDEKDIKRDENNDGISFLATMDFPKRLSHDTTDPLVLEGREAFEVENWSLALDSFEKAGLAGNFHAIFWWSQTLKALGRQAQVLELWRVAAKTGDWRACNNYANELKDMGDLKGAQTWYLNAAESGDPRPMFNYAVTLDREAQFQEREFWLRKATAAGNLRAQALLGKDLWQRGEWSEGLALVDSAMAKKSVPAYHVRALMAFDIKEFDLAIELCEQALTLEENAEDNSLKELIIDLSEMARQEKRVEKVQQMRNVEAMSRQLDPLRFGPAEGLLAAEINAIMMEIGDDDGDSMRAFEKAFVTIAERPALGSIAYSALNTLVHSILIPQRRFAEGRVWCRELIERNVGYESWNAKFNLAVIEFESGHTETAASLFKEIILSGDGPQEEASGFLAMIQEGEVKPLDGRANWAYSEEWRELTNEDFLDASWTPRKQYLWLLMQFDEQGVRESTIRNYENTPAATVYGMAVGVLNSLRSQGSTLDREVIVRLCDDFLTHKIPRKTTLLKNNNGSAFNGKKFCTECGTKVVDGADRFCVVCGNRL